MRKKSSYQMPNFWRLNNDQLNRFKNQLKLSQSIPVLLDRKTLYAASPEEPDFKIYLICNFWIQYVF
jgi:hypothetical protein